MKKKFIQSIYLLILLGMPTINWAQWEYIKGDYLQTTATVYGKLNEPSKANIIGDRGGALTWVYKDDFYALGGETNSLHKLHNDIWKFDRNSQTWTWIKGSDTVNSKGYYIGIGLEDQLNNPPGIAGNPHWQIDNRLYVFNLDLWCYNMETNNWAIVKKGDSAHYGEQGEPHPNNNPGLRSSSLYWVYEGDLYLLGGGGKSDMWRFDTKTNMWTWIKGLSRPVPRDYPVSPMGIEDTANLPSAMGNNPFWLVGNELYVFGTGVHMGTHWLRQNIWVYNHTTNNWKIVKGVINDETPFYGIRNVASDRNTPGNRINAITWYKNNKLYLYGGAKNSTLSEVYYSDIWEYDIQQNQWRWIKGDDSENPLGYYYPKGYAIEGANPSARNLYYSYKWKYKDEIYIHRGIGHLNAAALELDMNYRPRTELRDLWKLETSNNIWTWVAGTDNSHRRTINHTVAHLPSLNRPGAAAPSGNWKIGADVYFYGTLYTNSFYYLGDNIWKYNCRDNQWTNVRTDTYLDSSVTAIYGIKGVADARNTPGARGGQVFWTGKDKLYLFGGDNESYRYPPIHQSDHNANVLFNDLWVFDLKSREWTWINGSNSKRKTGIYGIQGQFNSDNCPGSRRDAFYWSTGDKFYMFGGLGFGEIDSFGLLNDLWEYDPNLNQWRWLSGSKGISKTSVHGIKGVPDTKNSPGSRYEGLSWTLNNKLYMFSGRGVTRGFNSSSINENNRISELWEYDPATNMWTWIKGEENEFFGGIYASYGTMGVPSASNRCGPRTNSSGVAYNNKLFLFSGLSEGERSAYLSGRNDVWQFDLSDTNWTWLHGDKQFAERPVYPIYATTQNPESPGMLSNHSAWIYNGYVYVFGGMSAGSSTNDIWRLRLEPGTATNEDSLLLDLGSDTTLCTGKYLELNAGNYGSRYLWNTGDTVQAILVSEGGSYWVKVFNETDTISDTIQVTFLDAPDVPFWGRQTICVGEKYELDAKNTGCTYTWNTGHVSQKIIVDSAAFYKVTVENSGGCQSIGQLELETTAIPEFNFKDDIGVCQTSQYSYLYLHSGYSHPLAKYLWNTGDTTDGITVVKEGLYSITATNYEGCSASDSVYVTFEKPVTFTLGNDTTICQNTPLVLNAYQPGYYGYYKWSTGSTDSAITVSTPGRFEVYIRSKYGCESHAAITVTVVPAPPENFSLGADTTICQNQPLLLKTNLTGYNHYWSTGSNASSIRIDSAGIYSVKIVGQNGCYTEDSILVDVINGPIGSASQIDTLIDGLTVHFSAVGMQYTDQYLWLFGDGSTDVGQNVSHTYSAPGSYPLKLILINECDSMALDTTIVIYDSKSNEEDEDSTTSLTNLSSRHSIHIYPNPASNFLMLESGEVQIDNLYLFNALGQRVSAKVIKVKNGLYSLDLKHIPSGVYHLKAVSFDKTFYKTLSIIR